jgi:putative transposase
VVEDLKSQAIDVVLSCKTLGVSRSGYYDWLARSPSKRKIANEGLTERIKEIHQESRETYGSPRVYQSLKREGYHCGENRVARLMQKSEIRAVTHKKFRCRTTNSDHDGPIANRVFEVENARAAVIEPNQVWAGDITYIETDEGWLFLAVFLDVFTRKIVGHAMRDNLRTELVLEALDAAIARQACATTGLVAHSDRGVQYAANEFRDRLNESEMQPSMSRSGNCYDNAYVESFFKSLKTELVYQRKFRTRKEASQAIFEYIEVFYNRERLHSGIGYQSPADFERQQLAS